MGVYVGRDPISRKKQYLRATAPDEARAKIELGKLLEKAQDGRGPDSDVEVARLLDEYAATAEWELLTRESNEGYIRRTLKPALGHLEVRNARDCPRSASCKNSKSFPGRPCSTPIRSWPMRISS